ncbi:MAG: C_GCAxxG_C_C family protein [Nitrospiraceae bacterium]|jgi:C_GCAxxG_C_C family probable redox protein|nr:MAG: C_GCAxxG_C_C family protein [Nitrospiraceae bacterium]
MENKEKIEDAKERARELFEKDRFACSEAILYTINAILGNPLPSEIVRLASGFTGGIGKSGNTCGALTGGVMALGLAFGRTEPDADFPKLLPATRDLLNWFDQAYGSFCCAVLTDKDIVFDVRQTDICSVITGETAAKTMTIILKYENMSSGEALSQRVV